MKKNFIISFVLLCLVFTSALVIAEEDVDTFIDEGDYYLYKGKIGSLYLAKEISVGGNFLIYSQTMGPVRLVVSYGGYNKEDGHNFYAYGDYVSYKFNMFDNEPIDYTVYGKDNYEYMIESLEIETIDISKIRVKSFGNVIPIKFPTNF